MSYVVYPVLGHLVSWLQLSQSLCRLKFAATVYKAINIINRRNYAIKLEPVHHGKPSSLEQESCILNHLHEGTAVGIPHVHWFGRESNFDTLVLDLLGPSLQNLVTLRERFNIITVQHVGDQLVSFMYAKVVSYSSLMAFQLSSLQYIHSRGYVHGDVQPFNILIGVDPSPAVFLVDFGLSKPYRHLTTGKHVPFRWKCDLTGTPTFASINGHLGGETGRRDDLESMVYVLIYLLSGSLPWLQICPHKKPTPFTVLKLKQTTAVEQLCSKYNAPELATMLLYARMFSFTDTPNYDYMCYLLRSAVPQAIGDT
ncbi:kinase-like domain-containing protein [Boletus reticuloceps]|uniref:Kinase-like domain-containing protein n=1 Tax=Boletus reticuloceps TaxID=495285 RepID=A0A8I3A2P2_9AGAM|nr:kinase-like domain-containing protein [Boletus reticuloceps]